MPVIKYLKKTSRGRANCQIVLFSASRYNVCTKNRSVALGCFRRAVFFIFKKLSPGLLNCKVGAVLIIMIRAGTGFALFGYIILDETL